MRGDCMKFMKNKRGMFALSKTVEWILLILGLIALIFFVYLLRDRINEYAKLIINFMKP